MIVGCSSAKTPDPIGDPDGEKLIEEPIPELRVGAERTEVYLSELEGKRVGIVGNQSSLIGSTHLVDSLLSLGVDIKKVYSPEHGFRGDADAGEHVKSGTDSKTGLPVVSLYGSNKKPTKEQLSGIDVIVFDIQDVGVRFYTYISTLHYVIEACGELDIPVICLDRPNPNGHYVDGPVLEKAYESFVGMHEVPIVYGMTIGEYGKMIVGEGWTKADSCDYSVIACENYDHQMRYSLPIPPSPNLRSDYSIALYPSLCLLEATTVTVGRGTDGPFERFGHPDFPASEFSFTPKPGYGSKNPKHNGILCHGYNLRDSVYLKLDQLDLSFILRANGHLEGKLFVNREKFFNLLAGNGTLIKQLQRRESEESIRASWRPKLNKFMEIRSEYLLYED